MRKRVRKVRRKITVVIPPRGARRLIEPEFWEDEDAMLEEWMFSGTK